MFAHLVSYIENDEIRPLLAGTYPLRDIEAAQRQFLTKHHVGNVILVP